MCMCNVHVVGLVRASRLRLLSRVVMSSLGLKSGVHEILSQGPAGRTAWADRGPALVRSDQGLHILLCIHCKAEGYERQTRDCSSGVLSIRA